MRTVDAELLGVTEVDALPGTTASMLAPATLGRDTCKTGGGGACRRGVRRWRAPGASRDARSQASTGRLPGLSFAMLAKGAACARATESGASRHPRRRRSTAMRPTVSAHR